MHINVHKMACKCLYFLFNLKHHLMKNITNEEGETDSDLNKFKPEQMWSLQLDRLMKSIEEGGRDRRTQSD